MKRRVVVAMSGGVDSSTAALLLLEQGYDVVGIMMRLWSEPPLDDYPTHNRCCSPAAASDARRVADQLGIPFYLVDYSRVFKHAVVDYFVHEYSRGRTPNPCLVCNRDIKFGRLLDEARAMGADCFATGHYACISHAEGGARLLRARDAQKDQSYMLYMLGQAQLSRTIFPLGEYTKGQVRDIAATRGLPVADLPDSQDLCFVIDGDYRRFIRAYAPQALRSGPILDRSGRVFGEHEGLPLYTIGQRRGLGISANEPLYVLELDPRHNAVVVGTVEELGRTELLAEDVSYVSGEPPSRAMRVTAKIRYQAQEAPACWAPEGDRSARVVFDRRQRSITPGQAVVAYRGDVLIGGGIIA